MPENRRAAPDRRPALTRRQTLAGFGAIGLGAAAALTGCTSEAKAPTAAAAAASDPLGPLYTETLSLINAYDQAINADPEAGAVLEQLRDEHRQHAIALAGLMGAADPAISSGPYASGASAGASTGPSTPAPGVSPATLKELTAAEKTAQLNAAAAVKAAPSAKVATLAAIAACRSTHVAALAAMR